MEYVIIIASALTIIGTIFGTIFGFFRNLKLSMKKDFDDLEKRIDILDERMFLLATDKSLAQAILEEKMKEK